MALIDSELQKRLRFPNAFYKPVEAVNVNRDDIVALARSYRSRFSGMGIYQTLSALKGRYIAIDLGEYYQSHAAMILTGGIMTVFLKETKSVKDKYIIAHEIGHYVLHAGEGSIQDVYSPRAHEGRVDEQADIFACEFIAPKQDILDMPVITAEKVAAKFFIPPFIAEKVLKIHEISHN